MTPQASTDADTDDTRPITIRGRHVALEPGRLSIHSFVGGRFPRHRAEDPDRRGDLAADAFA